MIEWEHPIVLIQRDRGRKPASPTELHCFPHVNNPTFEADPNLKDFVILRGIYFYRSLLLHPFKCNPGFEVEVSFLCWCVCSYMPYDFELGPVRHVRKIFDNHELSVRAVNCNFSSDLSRPKNSLLEFVGDVLH